MKGKRSTSPVYHKLLPFSLLFLLNLVFFFRLFFPVSSIFMIPDFGESDVLHLNLPFKFILSDSLKNHSWPVWTPYIGSGFPILAEGQIGTFYLPNLVLFRFLPPVTAYNINLFLSFLTAAAGMYLFSREFKLTVKTSLLTSVIFTFSGFLAVHLNHFNLIQASCLLPLIFWSGQRLFTRPGFQNSVLWSFFVSEQIFTGHFYMVFITLTGLSVFLLSQIIFTSGKPDRRKLLNFLAFGFLAFLLTFMFSAIQLFPTFELWSQSTRKGGLPFETVTSYPYPFKNLITLLKPYAFGNPKNGTYPEFGSDWGIFWENTVYVGILPLVLALLAIFKAKNGRIRHFLLLLVFSFLLILGKYSPVYFIFSFPPFNFFRVPSKFLLLSAFSFSMLAGFTAEILFKKTENLKKNFNRVAGILLFTGMLLLILIDEYSFSYRYPPTTPSAWWTAPVEFPGSLPKSVGKFLTVGASSPWNSIFIKKGWQDMKPYSFLRNSLYPNYNAVFKIRSTEINTGGIIPGRYSAASQILKDIDTDDALNLATASASSANFMNLTGVTGLISAYRIDNPGLKLAAVINPPSKNLKPVLYYLNSNALPEAYVSYRPVLINTLEDLVRKLSDGLITDTKPVFVENPVADIQKSDNSENSVVISKTDDTHVYINASTYTRGILVLSESDYPGWTALIDGKKTELMEVNLMYRGIILPSGSHEVEFIFNSRSFDRGKTLTELTLITVASAVFLERLFSARKAPHISLPFRHPYRTKHSSGT